MRETREKLRGGARAFTALLLAGVLASGLLVAGCAGAASDAGSDDTTAASSTDGEKTTVKIAYLPITHALAVFEETEILAASEDSNVEIELVQYGSWSELMDALNAGQVDGASVLVELAMRAVEQGIDLRAVALGHRDGNVIVSSEDITQASDLAGKTIAIPTRQSSLYILVLQELEEAGLTEDDVTLTELSPAEMPSALASGQIDAYSVAEPFGAKGLELEAGHVLAYSSDLWEDCICCAFVLNGDFVEENPDVASELVSTYQTAAETLEADSDETYNIAASYLDQSEEVLTTSLEWISFDDLTIDEETYNQLADYVVEYGLSEDPPAYEDFVYDLVAE